MTKTMGRIGNLLIACLLAALTAASVEGKARVEGPGFNTPEQAAEA